MNLLNYIRWSNLKISYDLSPFTWSFKYDSGYLDYPCWFVYTRLLPLSILLVVDSGDRIDTLETITPHEEENTEEHRKSPKQISADAL